MTRTTKLIVTRKPRAYRKAKDMAVPTPTSETPTVLAETTQSSDPALARPAGKLGAIVDLLSREGGASIADIAGATGWQAHSIRGAIAGALRKKGFNAISAKREDGVRIYRLAAPELAKEGA